MLDIFSVFMEAIFETTDNDNIFKMNLVIVILKIFILTNFK